MRMAKFSRVGIIAMMIAICIAFLCSLTPALAATDLDSLGNSNDSSTSQVQVTDSGSSSDDSISDYLHSYKPVSKENMETANKYAGPIASAIGTATGFLLLIATALIFFTTALDLLYIAAPFLRSTLNPAYGAGGASGGGMAMGGMGMGRMGMGGMGGMSGGAQPATGRAWVSDEAINAVNLASAQAPAAGGMGMGMGGGMMGGMMGGGAPAQAPSTKSVIFTYLKKRMFFVIIFFVCTIILMSSALTDCGINLAELLVKVMNRFNGEIGNVNIQ